MDQIKKICVRAECGLRHLLAAVSTSAACLGEDFFSHWLKYRQVKCTIILESPLGLPHDHSHEPSFWTHCPAARLALCYYVIVNEIRRAYFGSEAGRNKKKAKEREKRNKEEKRVSPRSTQRPLCFNNRHQPANNNATIVQSIYHLIYNFKNVFRSWFNTRENEGRNKIEDLVLFLFSYNLNIWGTHHRACRSLFYSKNPKNRVKSGRVRALREVVRNVKPSTSKLISTGKMNLVEADQGTKGTLVSMTPLIRIRVCCDLSSFYRLLTMRPSGRLPGHSGCVRMPLSRTKSERRC